MKKARVYLVGAGPGDPELLTLKAARLIAAADVIVHDGLVGEGILELARADARLISVAKSRANHSVPQEGINATLGIERVMALHALIDESLELLSPLEPDDDEA